MAQYIAGLVEHGAQRQVDILEVRQQAPQVGGGEGPEKVILGWIVD